MEMRTDMHRDLHFKIKALIGKKSNAICSFYRAAAEWIIFIPDADRDIHAFDPRIAVAIMAQLTTFPYFFPKYFSFKSIADANNGGVEGIEITSFRRSAIIMGNFANWHLNNSKFLSTRTRKERLTQCPEQQNVLYKLGSAP
jgi:hypothetical protein